MRVHNDILKRQKLPAPLVSKRIWDERLSDIAHFEDYLTRQGTIILKFFLHVSRKEQKKRFVERLDRPDKNWKFSASDVHERGFWSDYMLAFEEAIRVTASKYAPWYVVPADNKWFARLLVVAAIVVAMEKLDLAYPTVDAEQKKELQAIREAARLFSVFRQESDDARSCAKRQLRQSGAHPRLDRQSLHGDAAAIFENNGRRAQPLP